MAAPSSAGTEVTSREEVWYQSGVGTSGLGLNLCSTIYQLTSWMILCNGQTPVLKS
jgi:hypothetical protein